LDVFRVPLANSWLEHFRSYIDIYDQQFRAWLGVFFGGLWLNRKGPESVALVGGLLYGGGVFLAISLTTNCGGYI